MISRRLRALLVAALALAGLFWCVSRLQALGAPFLPAFLTGAIPPAIHSTIVQLSQQAGALALQFGALLVTILQIAVAALTLVAILALLVALRRPRLERQGSVTTFRTRAPIGTAKPVAMPQRCPNCNRAVQADWVACPTCMVSLPARRVS